MNEFGEFLGTRFLGEDARKAILDAADKGTPTLDFGGVEGMSHSFADECFGVLVGDRGIAFLRDGVRFVGLRPDVKSVLRFVLAERSGKCSA